MKKPKIYNFFMHYLKSYGINKKKMFLFFFNYLKTEPREVLKKLHKRIISLPM